MAKFLAQYNPPLEFVQQIDGQSNRPPDIELSKQKQPSLNWPDDSNCSFLQEYSRSTKDGIILLKSGKVNKYKYQQFLQPHKN